MTDNPVILITRPEPQASRFARQLGQALGPDARILVCPLAETVFSDDPIDGDRFAAAAFTSESGVLGADRVWLGRRGRAFAVGDRTARVAGDAGWTTLSAGGRSADLAGLIARSGVSGPIVWPCGEDAGTDFVVTAEGLGVSITAQVVYRQRELSPDPATAEVLAQTPRIILPVFSPQSARRARRLLPAYLSKISAVAISEQASRAFGGNKPITVADRPDGASMIHAIAAIFHSYAP